MKSTPPGFLTSLPLFAHPLRPDTANTTLEHLSCLGASYFVRLRSAHFRLLDPIMPFWKAYMCMRSRLLHFLWPNLSYFASANLTSSYCYAGGSMAWHVSICATGPCFIGTRGCGCDNSSWPVVNSGIDKARRPVTTSCVVAHCFLGTVSPHHARAIDHRQAASSATSGTRQQLPTDSALAPHTRPMLLPALRPTPLPPVPMSAHSKRANCTARGTSRTQDTGSSVLPRCYIHYHTARAPCRACMVPSPEPCARDVRPVPRGACWCCPAQAAPTRVKLGRD
ncbi:hypothetical protein OH77DRAFT_219786 [Trametes cingulata]|nr:hypothetical protein OH77DRAFT_219786 [Trametes cingulata]